MDNKMIKQLTIIDVLKNDLRSGFDSFGECGGNINVDFILSQSISFNSLGTIVSFDRIKMLSDFSHGIIFRLANKDGILSDVSVPRTFVHKIYDLLPSLQSSEGILSGYYFSDMVFDILRDIDKLHNFSLNIIKEKNCG